MNDFWETFKTIGKLEEELINKGLDAIELMTNKINLMVKYQKKLEFTVTYSNYLLKELKKYE